jgi:hypothetical protein
VSAVGGRNSPGRQPRREPADLTQCSPAQQEPGGRPQLPERPDVMWGWTLQEIHTLARTAALANKWLVSDFTIRYEAAWDGIIDALLQAEARPEAHDLARAGKGAVSRGLLKDFCHTYGVADRDLCAGVGSAPRFAAYWLDPGCESAQDQLTERIALRQVLAALGERHAEVLTALAAGGTTGPPRPPSASRCPRTPRTPAGHATPSNGLVRPRAAAAAAPPAAPVRRERVEHVAACPLRHAWRVPPAPAQQRRDRSGLPAGEHRP